LLATELVEFLDSLREVLCNFFEWGVKEVIIYKLFIEGVPWDEFCVVLLVG
jgi:hypothetical protein